VSDLTGIFIENVLKIRKAKGNCARVSTVARSSQSSITLTECRDTPDSSMSSGWTSRSWQRRTRD
jgi:hypothetical protein